MEREREREKGARWGVSKLACGGDEQGAEGMEGDAAEAGPHRCCTAAAGAGPRDASTGGRRAMAGGLRAEGGMEGGSLDVEGRDGRETGEARGESRCNWRVELIGAARGMGGWGVRPSRQRLEVMRACRED
jgi:hypothetical protein